MSKFELSRESGNHAELAKLEGEWEGTITTWFEPDSIADQSPITGSFRSALGGRFIIHEYRSSFGGKPTEGLAIFGYHIAMDQFQSAWIDSFHTGTAIMFSQSERGEADLNVLGGYAYITPETEQQWGWRTILNRISENEIRITCYNISPEGEEQKATETVYGRVGSR